MATVRFVEIDGTRHDYDRLTTVTETRCDACGEFVGLSGGVHGQVIVMITGRRDARIEFDAHTDHLAVALADAQRKAAELALP